MWVREIIITCVVQRSIRREMAEKRSAISYLSVAMATMDSDEMSTTGANNKASSSSNFDLYFSIAVVVIALVGIAVSYTHLTLPTKRIV